MALAVRFAPDQLFSMDEMRARILGSEGATGVITAATGGESCDNELVAYFDEQNGDDLYFAVVPVDSHVNIPASLCRNFDAIHEL